MNSEGFGWAALLGSALLFGGCGKAKPAAEPPPAAPTEASADSSDMGDVSAEEAEALAAIEAESSSIEAEADGGGGGGSADPNQPRDLTYRVSPEGLRVEVLGITFSPTAKAVKVPGGYGLELVVDAESTAERSLLSPNNGPLAFGGRVIRAKGGEEKFGDARKGTGDLALGPAGPTKFSRKWPGDGVAPLAPGDQLELHVGLWGLGTTTTDRRPVKRFLIVTMKADQKGGVPAIQPPAQ